MTAEDFSDKWDKGCENDSIDPGDLFGQLINYCYKLEGKVKKKRIFHFDYIGNVTCGKNNMRVGEYRTEPIKAWDEEHATLLFKEKHSDTPFDPPY